MARHSRVHSSFRKQAVQATRGHNSPQVPSANSQNTQKNSQAQLASLLAQSASNSLAGNALRSLEETVSTFSRYDVEFFRALYHNIEPDFGSCTSGNLTGVHFDSLEKIFRASQFPEIRAKNILSYTLSLMTGIIRLPSSKIAEKKKLIHDFLESVLFLKDAVQGGFLKDVEKTKAQKLIDECLQTSKFSTVPLKDTPIFDDSYWSRLKRHVEDVSSETFESDCDWTNAIMYMQLLGNIPISPICNQLLPLELLGWQKRMHQAVKESKNVIVCAPPSSGKTWMAIGIIMAKLIEEPKSSIIYIAPNDQIAMEIAALFNKQPDLRNKVGINLDENSFATLEERITVATPFGFENARLADRDVLPNSLLVIDECHSIGDSVIGPTMERALFQLSIHRPGVERQTLLLSATMSDETIQKFSQILSRTSRPCEIISEKTRFVVPQSMVLRSNEVGTELVPVNPLGSLTAEDLADKALNISVTPYDAYQIFLRIRAVFKNSIPANIHPLFAFSFPVDSTISLAELFEQLKEVPEEEQIITSLAHRLSDEDISIWLKNMIHFLASKSGDTRVQEVLDFFKNSLTDESVCMGNIDSAFDLAHKLKKQERFPAMFFHNSLHHAIEYACGIYDKLSRLPIPSSLAKRENELDKQISELEKRRTKMEARKLGKGEDSAEWKEKIHHLRADIDKLKEEQSKLQVPHSLASAEEVISYDNLIELLELYKLWNPAISEYHPLVQMVPFGLGILSEEMPLDLQVFIRKLYHEGKIVLLMATDSCMYGINTPTRTVVLSNDLSKTQRQQAGGRAGRKNLANDAFIVSFRLTNNRIQELEHMLQADKDNQSLLDELACCRKDLLQRHCSKLEPLEGTTVKYVGEKSVPNESLWISNFEKLRFSCDPRSPEQKMCEYSIFMDKTLFLLGAGSFLTPLILEKALLISKEQTNREIAVLMSLIPSTSFNDLGYNKRDWAYSLPKEVTDLYQSVGMVVEPNYILYSWLMNDSDQISDQQKVILLKYSKVWSYMIHLLKGFFTKCGEIKLYKSIRAKLDKCVLLTACST